MFQTISSTGSAFPNPNGVRIRRVEHNSNSNIFDAAKFVPIKMPPRPEIQRLNMEYDRQRHLANWILDSNTHAFNQKETVIKNENKKSKKVPLRRYNSHESNNIFNVQITGFENQNYQPEAPKKSKSLIKKLSPFESSKSDNSNSLESNPELKKYTTGSSGSSKFKTNSSKNSKNSNGEEFCIDYAVVDKNEKVMTCEAFVERYSLPRVARINGAAPEVVYRYLPGHAVIQAKTIRAKGRPGRTLNIPRGYQGWFSLVNDKCDTAATAYTTIMHLVRERVYKFVSADAIVAYSEALGDSGKPHYVRGSARAGQVFRLLAVFQDGVTNDVVNGTNASRGQGQYAQLLGDNQQVVYVSLTTKGKFYEISPVVPPGGFPSNLNKPQRDNGLDKDCVHRLSTIINNSELPVTVKLLSGPLPDIMSTDFSDTLVLQSIHPEPILVTCSFAEGTDTHPPKYQLSKVKIKPDLTLSRCLLGYDTENRLFKSSHIKNVLAFCNANYELWFRQIEVVENEETKTELPLKPKIDGLKLLKSSNFAKFLWGEKNVSSHEKEDSIIFLSKHDLEHVESETVQSDAQKSQISPKMKVFEPSKRSKWFKHFKILQSNEPKDYKQEITDKYREFMDPFDPTDKHKSIERYQDMAKLIEERFGNKGISNNAPKKSASFLSSKKDSVKKPLNKSQSLSIPNFDVKQDQIESLTKISDDMPSQPDLIPVEDFDKIQRYDDIEEDVYKNKSSFITDKLCAEFHVKTKQLSKSTSSLNQILHFSVPQKMNIKELKKDATLNDNETLTKVTVHSTPKHVKIMEDSKQKIQDIQNRKLPVIDDLPYNTVKDALGSEIKMAVKPEELENIYAEICGDINFENGLFLHSSQDDDKSIIEIKNEDIRVIDNSNVKKYISEASIKIKVYNEDNNFEDKNNITIVKSEDEGYVKLKENEVNDDNIYNTLK